MVPPPGTGEPDAPGTDLSDTFLRLRRWSRLLDAAFRIPGTRIRFGWDPLLGLVPGLGDLVTPLFSALLIVHAARLGLPRIVILRMLVNVGLDAVLGVVPVAGDLFDVAWKANQRNVRLLEARLGEKSRSRAGDWVFVGTVLAAVALVAALPLVVVLWVATWIL